MKKHEKIKGKNVDIFGFLLDSFPDMIHSVDEVGNIVYANRTAEQLLGYSLDELYSMNVREIYADEILSEMERGFKELKLSGDKSTESILKTRNGSKIPVEIRSFGIYDDEGNFIRTFSILRDIRRIKQLQQELVHAGRLAAIGELATGIVHDLNNPLSVVVLSNEIILELLQGGKPPTGSSLERLKRFSGNISKALLSIEKLVDHLRTFGRGVEEKNREVDLFTSISDALFMTQNKLANAQIEVRNSTEKGRFFVNGISNQLEQVFVNLVGNACDSMVGRPRRELAIAVHSAARDGEHFWRCDVIDTGTGLSGEMREMIFNSFFTTKKSGEGTGLGLSISRGIIRDHNGEIEVSSTLGEGTTFSVFLPQAKRAGEGKTGTGE